METSPSIFYRWRFSPVAKTSDPRWQGRRIWQELVVAAPSPDIALRLADNFYANSSGGADGRCAITSGFDDPLLYELDQRDVISDPFPVADTMYARPFG